MENFFHPAIVKLQPWRFFFVLLLELAELDRNVPGGIQGIQSP